MQLEEQLEILMNFEQLYREAEEERQQLQKKHDDQQKNILRGSLRGESSGIDKSRQAIFYEDQIALSLDMSGDMKPITEREESEEYDADCLTNRKGNIVIDQEKEALMLSASRDVGVLSTLIKAVKYYYDKYKHAEEMHHQLKQLTKGENSLLLHSRSDPGLIELNFSNSRQDENIEKITPLDDIDVKQLIRFAQTNLGETLMQIFDQVIKSSQDGDIHTAVQFQSSIHEIFSLKNIQDQRLHRDLFIYMQSKILNRNPEENFKDNSEHLLSQESEEANLIQLYREI